MAKLIEITGKALSGEWGLEDESKTGIPVLRTTNFTNFGIINYGDVVTRNITKKNISEKFLRKGDIIIEKSGGSDKQPVGRVVLFNGEENRFLFNNFTSVLRVKDREKWVPEYVFYALFVNYRNGGTRKYENKTTGLHNLKTDLYINNYEIEWVNIAEQKNVCTTLRKIESIISDMNKEIDYLDELIKARFVEMFGDRFLNTMNWPTKKLGDCATFRNGKAHEKVISETGQYVLITSRAIASDLQDVRHTDSLLTPLSTGDIVMVMSDIPNGKALAKCLLITENEKYTLNQRICSLSNYGLNPVFFTYLLNRHRFFLLFNDGNGQTNLRKDDILNCPLITPPIELQSQFAAFVAQVDKSKFALQNSIKSLMNLWYNINNMFCERTYGEA